MPAHATPQDVAQALPAVLAYGRPVLFSRDGGDLRWKLARDRVWQPLNDELFHVIAARLDFVFSSNVDGELFIFAPAVLNNKAITMQCMFSAIELYLQDN